MFCLVKPPFVISSPVSHLTILQLIIYNPLQYASEPHANYVRRYCKSSKKIVFLGMNPGPFGMAQNGVPFGQCKLVKEFLKIDGHVSKPSVEHPKRPISGFECTTNEVSGGRFWSLVAELTQNNPEKFFTHCYVHNYCPLVFMDAKGKNITPATLNRNDGAKLEQICDSNLALVIESLGTATVVGVGKYAADRATKALAHLSPEVSVHSLLHPSPANPATNKPPGWQAIATERLQELKILHIVSGLEVSDSE